MTVGGGSCCRGRRRRPGLGLGLDPRPLLLHTALTAALLLLMGLPGAEGLRVSRIDLRRPIYFIRSVAHRPNASIHP